MSFDCDVLVLGGGASGLAAAITAADMGASVIVLDAGDRTGGSAALSAGVVYGAGTKLQRSLGIDDDAEAMFTYYMALNQWKVEPALIRRLSEESGPAIDWLADIGVEFPADGLFSGGVDNVRRAHTAAGSGAELMATVGRAARSHPNITIHNNVRAEKLLVENGQICGVEIDDTEMRAGAVMLATGGFAANPQMLERYVPHLVSEDPDWSAYTVAAATSQGDALTMGRDIGADIVGFDVMTPPKLTPKFSRELSDYHPSWLVMVNADGRRFMSETAPYCVNGHLTRSQSGGVCHVILDQAMLDAADWNQPLAKLAGIHGGDFVYVGERIKAELETGRVKQADSLRELAQELGINGTVLEGQVARYNRDVERGEDTQFLKTGDLKPLSSTPYYGFTLYPASFGATCTGLRIDVDGRVLNELGDIIQGLFAAGEAAGGLIGERYVGSGVNLAIAFSYGRVSARTAVQHAGRRTTAEVSQ